MASCALLSAGSSQRFRIPKLLAVLEDTTVIKCIQQTLIPSQISEIIIVLGDHAEEIKSHILKHKKVRVVYSKDYKLGQTFSFQAGLREDIFKIQWISSFAH